MIKRNLLVSYNFQAGKENGWGSINIVFTTKWWKGYTEKNLHQSRKVIADSLRQKLGLTRNVRVNVVIIAITKFPL